ncbi:MAG: hypothetical protein ABL949_00585 [Fimbriimonadaceae bacterium]
MLRKTSGLGLLLILGISGCSQERVQPVFVDVDRVMRLEPATPPAAAISQFSPELSAVESANIKGEGARQIAGADTLSRRKQIESLIASNRRDAEADLADRLRQAYLSEVNKAEASLLEKYGVDRQGRLKAALEGLRPIFDAYAEERAPKIVRLSMHAGFPDTDPKSTKKRIGVVKGGIFAEEARILREDLTRIDADYEKAVEIQIASADNALSEALIEIRLKVEALRLAADKRAKQEAAELVAKQTASLDDVASIQSQLEFAPTRAEQPKPGNTPAVTPKVGGPLTPSGVKMKMRRALELEAEIWAATSGFKLSTSRNAPDRTTEFLSWKQNHRAGP